MSRFALFYCLFAVFAAGECPSVAPHSEVALTTLSKPVYPKLARQARVAGDVELRIYVKRDGGIESAEVISGPAMLRQSALESVRQSQFECRDCRENLTSYRMTYTFQTVSPEYGPDCEIKHDATYPQVIQSQNHVTVIDEAAGTCDPIETTRKIRSLKCLYLWKCGRS